MGCHFLLQGIFPTQGSNSDLPHCGQDALTSEPPGKPTFYQINLHFVEEDYAWLLLLSLADKQEVHLVSHQISNFCSQIFNSFSIDICWLLDINLDLWVDIFCRKNEISNLFNSELLSPILCVYLNPQMPKHRCKVYDEFSEEWSFIKWGRWHFIVIWILKMKVTQSCLTLCDSMDCSMPGSSVHGVLQARTLEWVAIPFFRGSSQPRDRTQVPSIAEPQGKP